MTAVPPVPARFLRVSDLDAGGLVALLDLAAEVKEQARFRRGAAG